MTNKGGNDVVQTDGGRSGNGRCTPGKKKKLHARQVDDRWSGTQEEDARGSIGNRNDLIAQRDLATEESAQ